MTTRIDRAKINARLRAYYANGDEINLACGCDGCSPARINGVLCHETGCPQAWRDQPKECYECGCDVYSPGRLATSVICEDCQQIANEDYYEDHSDFCGECGNRFWADEHDLAHLGHDSVAFICPHCFLAEYGEDYEEDDEIDRQIEENAIDKSIEEQAIDPMGE